MNKKWMYILMLVALVVPMVLTACGATPEPTTAPEAAEPTKAPEAAEPTKAPEAAEPTEAPEEPDEPASGEAG